MKTYVLRLSTHFMVGHPRKGTFTFFVEKVRTAIACEVCDWRRADRCLLPADGKCLKNGLLPKEHTCRENYAYWSKVAKEVNAGRAILSLRYWRGKPFGKGSKQVEFARLTKIGVQPLTLADPSTGLEAYVNGKPVEVSTLARNDGLSVADFEAWFAPQLRKENVWEGVVVHFTDFRY